MKGVNHYYSEEMGTEEDKQKLPMTVSECFCENTLELLYDHSCANFSDVIVCVDKKEVRAHKAILAAQSYYFRKLFRDSPSLHRVEFHQPWNIVNQLIICIYGGRLDTRLDPKTLLDVLAESRSLQMPIVSCWDITNVITEKLTIQNAADLLSHPEIEYHNNLCQNICKFIASNLKEMLKNNEHKETLKKINKEQLMDIISEGASIYNEFSNIEILLHFVLEWIGIDNMCDLLKESKSWIWKNKSNSSRQRKQSMLESYIDLSTGKSIKRCVNGSNFNWWIQIEKESSQKFKIIFDGVSLGDHISGNISVGRFPTATFNPEIIPQQDQLQAINPVFVCFSENTPVHWSTSFDVNPGYKQDFSSHSIKFNVIENPLASLIMYYFSCNLPNKMVSEDIINRLPHVEYRCLASYFLYNDHIKRSIENLNQPIRF